MPISEAMELSKQLGARKEEAIRSAIYHVFGDKWDEGQIADRCSFEINQDIIPGASGGEIARGSEFFLIDGKLMLEFSPIQTDTEITANGYVVTCRFYQQIKVLF